MTRGPVGRQITWRGAILVLAVAPAVAAGAHAQAEPPRLTLAEALRRADSAGFANRIAAGQVEAQQAQGTAALRGILPTVRLDAGWMRTTDPLNAFGFLLRQRGVTQASFDPNRLNFPDPITNVSAATVAEVPLLNLDAWMGRAAAGRAAGAVDAGAAWTRSGARVDAVRGYYGAVLARQSVAVLERAFAAATSHVRQAESLTRNGVVTRSDALLAQVKAGEVEARLAQARADADLGASRLALALGATTGPDFELPAALPAQGSVRALAEAELADTTPARRDDVAAAELGEAAADADARRATSLYVPRVNSFARYDWNSATALFGGPKSWTVGVMASWSPFAGASEIAERKAAGGRRAAARAQAEAARAMAQVEQARAVSVLRVALIRLDIAERSVAQAAEAHRIVARKYEGGLATITELLDASAAETGADLGLAAARYDVIVALAEARRALGRDVTTLAALDGAE